MSDEIDKNLDVLFSYSLIPDDSTGLLHEIVQYPDKSVQHNVCNYPDEIDKNLDVLFKRKQDADGWMIAVDKTTYDVLKHDPYFKPMCGDEAAPKGEVDSIGDN